MLNLSTESEPRRNLNPNLNNLVIGFYHQSCAFWRMGLNGYLLLLLGFWRVGLLRGKEKMVYWCMPLFLPCFLSSFYCLHSFSFYSVLSLSLLLLSCYGSFSFPFMAIAPFYSGPIAWDFSLLPLGLVGTMHGGEYAWPSGLGWRKGNWVAT